MRCVRVQWRHCNPSDPQLPWRSRCIPELPFDQPVPYKAMPLPSRLKMPGCAPNERQPGVQSPAINKTSRERVTCLALLGHNRLARGRWTEARRPCASQLRNMLCATGVTPRGSWQEVGNCGSPGRSRARPGPARQHAPYYTGRVNRAAREGIVVAYRGDRGRNCPCLDRQHRQHTCQATRLWHDPKPIPWWEPSCPV